MNRRTAKFLRSVAAVTNSSYRELKRGWNKMPHNNKGQVRKNLQEAVNVAKDRANV